MKARLAAILALAATPACPHRLDQYLQGTILSVEKTQVQAQMTLTPGVAVFPLLIADIDTDRNGTISETEQRTYAARVLHDLSIEIDDHALVPRLTSIRFPSTDEMKEGRGEIELDFSVDLPPGGRNRKLTIENHHQSRIAAYQVNCLVPRDPDIAITGQTRNNSQSFYRLDYVQTNVGTVRSASVWLSRLVWLVPGVLLALTWVALNRQPRATSR